MNVSTRKARNLRDGDKVLVVDGHAVVLQTVRSPREMTSGDVEAVVGGRRIVYEVDSDVLVATPAEGGRHA